MQCPTQIYVPLSFFEARELSPAAKLVWLVLAIDAYVDPCCRLLPQRLANRTGLSTTTVKQAVSRLISTGWFSTDPDAVLHKPTGPLIPLPAQLVFDKALDPQEKALAMLMYAEAHGASVACLVRYLSLCHDMKLSEKVIRGLIKRLVQKGWVTLHLDEYNQDTYRMRNPVRAHYEAEKERVERRLLAASHMGEALMREYLNLIVDSDNYMDDSYPSYLLNDFTYEHMTLTRYYPHHVAFSYNDINYGRLPRPDDDIEHIRQGGNAMLIKGYCGDRGIVVVEVFSEDLTLTTMRDKVGNLLPLRDLSDYAPVISLLESYSVRYRDKTPGRPSKPEQK